MNSELALFGIKINKWLSGLPGLMCSTLKVHYLYFIAGIQCQKED